MEIWMAPVFAFVGAMLGTVGGVMADRYLLRKSVTEKQREKIITKKIEAYEVAHGIMVEIEQKSFKNVIDEIKAWSKKYDLYSTTETATIIYDLLIAIGENEKNPSDDSKNEVQRLQNLFRKTLQDELGIELADPDVVRKIWGL